MGSFIGAYKVLSHVIPGCSVYLAPLDDTTAGSQSQEPIYWTDELRGSFSKAQRGLSTCRMITLHKPDNHVWIATNGAVRKPDIRATLYVMRIATSSLAGFFSAKLRVAQITWLLCEVKALSIATAAKHFSPSVVQSYKTPAVPPAVICTDNPPGFIALVHDKLLHQYKIYLKLDHAKKLNKNPVAEKAIRA